MTMIEWGIAGRNSDQIEPFAVSPRQACRLLSIGNTRLCQLISAAELTSYLDGRARRIPVLSIREYVARKLAATNQGQLTASHKRRRGQGRNHPVSRPEIAT